MSGTAQRPAAAPPPPPLSPKQAGTAAARIARGHFARGVRHLAQLSGGETNAVFGFRVGSAGYVIRLNANATKIQDFLKEQWAMERAHEHGVPISTVLEVGNDPHGVAYMIQQTVAGIAGSRHPERLAVLRELGGHARRIHAIRTQGNGAVFDWSRNQLSKHANWARFLDEGLHADERLALLLRHRLLSKPQAAAAAATLAAMRRWRKPPVLQHGDLRLKNTLVDPDSGRIAALIDWEGCISAPPPYWDLSIALHDLGLDEKEALLDGYGLAPAQFDRAAPFLGALNLLNYARAIDALLRNGDRRRLAWYRIRMQGGMDPFGPVIQGH